MVEELVLSWSHAFLHGVKLRVTWFAKELSSSVASSSVVPVERRLCDW